MAMLMVVLVIGMIAGAVIVVVMRVVAAMMVMIVGMFVAMLAVTAHAVIVVIVVVVGAVVVVMIVIVAVRLPGAVLRLRIGAAFGIERRFERDHAGAETLGHRLDDGIATNSQRFRRYFGR